MTRLRIATTIALGWTALAAGCATGGEPPAEPIGAVDDPVGFRRTVERDLRAGFLTPAQADEIDRQRQELERRRPELAPEIEAAVIAVAGGGIFVGESPAAALALVDAKLPGALVYMESGADWIYDWAFSQSALDNRIEFWSSNGRFPAETLRDLAAQRDAVENAVIARHQDSPLWFAHIGGKLYSARSRAELVEVVAKDHPDALVYCTSPAPGRWDAIPAGLAYGDAFLDVRGMTATAVEIGCGADPRSRLVKADWGSATPITVLAGDDLAGLAPRYRGILVSMVYPWGHRGSVGLVGDLHLRLRLANGSDAAWAPALVLLAERSILGLDLCRELRVWPQPAESATESGGRAFIWVRGAD